MFEQLYLRAFSLRAVGPHRGRTTAWASSVSFGTYHRTNRSKISLARTLTLYLSIKH